MHRISEEDIARRSAIAEEQQFIDMAVVRRGRLAASLEAQLAPAASDEAGHARQRMLRQQFEEIRGAGDGLVFGRLDGDNQPFQRYQEADR